MARVKVISTGNSPICEKTKTLHSKRCIPYEDVRIDSDTAARREFTRVTRGARTVPQIAIDGQWIGGFTELTELHMDGKLDDLVD